MLFGMIGDSGLFILRLRKWVLDGVSRCSVLKLVWFDLVNFVVMS